MSRRLVNLVGLSRQPYQDKEFELFQHFIPDADYYKSFRSPLRVDNKPSAGLFRGENEIVLQDFTDHKFYSILTFYKALEKSKGKSIATKDAIHALNKIAGQLDSLPKVKSKDKGDRSFICVTKPVETGYLNLISSTTLVLYLISEIVEYEKGDEVIDVPAFAYRTPDGGLKVLKPYADDKWRIIYPTNYYDGEWLLKKNIKYDVVFITTSRKDSCIVYDCGFLAINSFVGEGEILDIDSLKSKFKVKKFIYIQDKDDPGRLAGKAYKELGADVIEVPGTAKDPFAYFEEHGLEALRTFLKSVL